MGPWMDLNKTGFYFDEFTPHSSASKWYTRCGGGGPSEPDANIAAGKSYFLFFSEFV